MKIFAMFDLMAKLTFCAARFPVISDDVSSLDTITPMTLPLSSTNGPPELPGCTGDVSCNSAILLLKPVRAAMLPEVTLSSEPSVDENG